MKNLPRKGERNDRQVKRSMPYRKCRGDRTGRLRLIRLVCTDQLPASTLEPI